MKRSRILRLLLVNLAVLGVGLVAFELLFGAWLGPDRLNRLNLIKRQTLEYDVSALYDAPSPIVRYSRDRYGLRGAYGDDPARIVLLTVGGSTTDQRYIADGSTWQDVLQQRFASAGRPLAVANAGVDGQSTVGHIKNFDWWFPYVPRLRPRYMVFYIGLNDFYIDDSSDHDDAASSRSGRHRLLTMAADNSAVWHLARTVRGAYRATALRIGHRKVDLARAQWVREPLLSDYAFLASRLDAYAGRLRILVDRARALEAQPIFVSQPSRHFRLVNGRVEGRAEVTRYGDRQINGVDFYHMMARFNRVMDGVCHERRVVCLDLAAEPAWDDDDFYDFNHMTPRGAQKLGHRLFERLTAGPGRVEWLATERRS